MIRLTFAFLIVGLILFGLVDSAFASSATAIQDFRNSATGFAQSVLARKQRYGDLDLGELVNRIQTVPIYARKSINRPERLGPFNAARDGAEWRPGEIDLNVPRWLKMRAHLKPMLAFHDSISAIYLIRDNNFECSSTLAVLTDPRSGVLSPQERAQLENVAERACRSAGGSTGVGGGGDDWNVAVRMHAISKGFENLASATDSDQRESAINTMMGLLHQGWGINRKGQLIDFKNQFKYMQLDRTPVLSTVRVLQGDRPIPYGGRNGWTWDAHTKRVLFHGEAARPTKMIGGLQGNAVIVGQWVD